MITDIGIGDVLAVRTTGLAVFMIRLGAALRGRPDLSNHIAIVHHVDNQGTTWCIEGRPGGVGWRDASDYLASPHTLSNRHQVKTDIQRAAIAKTVEKMLGTPYDWAAIVADGAADLHLGTAWIPGADGKVHGHTVCSALAAYAYDNAGLKRPPGAERTDQPADWDDFILENGYE